MNSTQWLHYFRQNRQHRPEPDWSRPAAHPPLVARHLARSLSHFQLGESGEGNFLIAQARQAYPDDRDYHEALALFIQEEQEHARLLAAAVARFGGSVIRRHWTHFVFRLLRRALGVHFEIQIHVIAELVGTAYYRVLGRHSVDSALRQLCEIVLRDEAQHIAFHHDRFSASHAHWLPIERAVWAAQFQLLFLGAACVAWSDHRSALLSVGATRREFFREARAECIAFLRGTPHRERDASVEMA